MYDEDYLAQVEALGYDAVDVRAWRFTVGASAPKRPNVRGARWNPPDLSALYLNTSREGAVEEGQHFLGLLPVVPRGPRRVHRVHVVLERLLDASSLDLLRPFSIDEATLDDSPGGYPACRTFGGAAAFLDRQGILVPSVHRAGTLNLVVFSDRLVAAGESEFEVEESFDL